MIVRWSDGRQERTGGWSWSDLGAQFLLGIGVLVPLFHFYYHDAWHMSALYAISFFGCFLLGRIGSCLLRARRNRPKLTRR